MPGYKESIDKIKSSSKELEKENKDGVKQQNTK